MQEIGTEITPVKTNLVEIKPKKPGLLRDSLKPKERTPPDKKLDYLIVFGQGPVLDEATKQKPLAKKPDVRVTAIAWMKNAARAAGELYLEGATKKIILTGGKTGGAEYKSEAELMKEILVDEYHISETDIILEDKATNTLQNIPLCLNKIDSERLHGSKEPKIGLLGADFHVPRIRILADLFGISDHKSFSAEQIFRTIAYKLEGAGGINEARIIHQQLDALLSMNDDLSFPESRFDSSENLDQFQTKVRESKISRSTVKSATFFENQTGKEKEGVAEKISLESYFSRGMVEVPEFWFGYVQFLNDDRLNKMISQTDDNILSRFGLKKETPIEEIRNILKPYTVGEPDGGKRLMLEKFYEIDNVTLAKAKIGSGLDEKATAAHDKLTAIAERLNKLGNK